MQQSAAAVELSIVIVCLNALPLLQDTLVSLSAIPEWRIRVYIVDGASSDGTPDFLADCPFPLSRWISEPDRGIYDAMNKGWNMTADDSYILFLGAGDRLVSLPSPESVAQDHRNGTDIILGDCDMGHWTFHSMWYDDLFVRNIAHHQTLMVRKSLCPESPFDTTFRAYADWEFNTRLFARGCKARHYSEFRSFALPGGISTRQHVGEAFRIGLRHGGLRKGLRALLKASKAEAKRRLELHREAKKPPRPVSPLS